MVLTYASWIHGNSVKFTDDIVSVDYTHNSATFVIQPPMNHELSYAQDEGGHIIEDYGSPVSVLRPQVRYVDFHFAIPTPVIVQGKRLHLDSVMLRFYAEENTCFVDSIKVYDGKNNIAVIGGGLNLNMTGYHPLQRFNVSVPPPSGRNAGGRYLPEVYFGVGISIRVKTTHTEYPEPRILELISAGADFLEDELVQEKS
jgi:hypothetical protein